MKQETIILLNGTSSSGKTSIARALQDSLDGYFIHTGIDHFLERTPKKLHVESDGRNPPSAEGFLWVLSEDRKRVQELRVGPAGLRLITGMYYAAAALAFAGNDVIIDEVIFDERALWTAVEALHELNVLFVGVRCPLEIAEQREQRRIDRFPGLAKAHYGMVHSHEIYDLELDTSVLSAKDCAAKIKQYLEDGFQPTAIRKLWNNLHLN